MDLSVFARWRLRLADMEYQMFNVDVDVELRILLHLYLGKNSTDRKSLLGHFKLDRITMRSRISSLINRKLIVSTISDSDRREKHYSLTPAGHKLLKAYRDEVVKLTFVGGGQE